MKDLIRHHRVFVVYLVLFFVVSIVDIFNFDRISYKAVCDLVAPISGSPCPPYYDIPIWHVYLSLAVLAGLYHVHDEVRTTNRHLSRRK